MLATLEFSDFRPSIAHPDIKGEPKKEGNKRAKVDFRPRINVAYRARFRFFSSSSILRKVQPANTVILFSFISKTNVL